VFGVHCLVTQRAEVGRVSELVVIAAARFAEPEYALEFLSGIGTAERFVADVAGFA